MARIRAAAFVFLSLAVSLVAANPRLGFTIGTTPGGNDTVANGVVQPSFANNTYFVRVWSFDSEYLFYLSLSPVMGAPNSQEYSATIANQQTNVFNAQVTVNAKGKVHHKHPLCHNWLQQLPCVYVCVCVTPDDNASYYHTSHTACDAHAHPPSSVLVFGVVLFCFDLDHLLQVTTSRGIMMRVKFACHTIGSDIAIITITYPTPTGNSFDPLYLYLIKDCETGFHDSFTVATHTPIGNPVGDIAANGMALLAWGGYNTTQETTTYLPYEGATTQFFLWLQSGSNWTSQTYFAEIQYDESVFESVVFVGTAHHQLYHRFSVLFCSFFLSLSIIISDFVLRTLSPSVCLFLCLFFCLSFCV